MKKLFTLVLLLIAITTFANMENGSDSSSFFIDIQNPAITSYTINGSDLDCNSAGKLSWWILDGDYNPSINLDDPSKVLNVAPTLIKDSGYYEDQFRYQVTWFVIGRVSAFINIKLYNKLNVVDDCIFEVEAWGPTILPTNIVNIKKIKSTNNIPYRIGQSGSGRFYIVF
ncbi:MAG: hypothetical protein ACP5OA_03035 [Candidatus Woesearchaeota archaeon]